MRIPEQGQAAVPGERVYRRRERSLPGRRFLGRRIRSCGLSQQWSAIRVYPSVNVYLGIYRACHGRFMRTMAFFCAIWGGYPEK